MTKRHHTEKDIGVKRKKYNKNSKNVLIETVEEEELDILTELPKQAKSLIHLPPRTTLSSKSKTTLLVVGDGSAGQLGLGSDVDEVTYPKILNLATTLASDDNLSSIYAGGMHSTILTKNDKIISFGCNDEGALGREGTESSPLIVEVTKAPIKVSMISCGDCHTAVLTSNGSVYAWGSFRDEIGILGLVTDKIQNLPTILYDCVKDPVIKIASGDNHILILTSTGTIMTCGSASQGQLGRLSSRTATRDQRKGPELLLKPSKVPLPLVHGSTIKVKDIFATSFSSFAISTENQIYAWGLNNYNQLGVSCELSSIVIYFPIKVNLGFSNIIQISGGPHHTLILSLEGQVYAMGRKEYGRLGLGDIKEDVIEPQLIPSFKGSPCSDVSAGENVSYAITKTGEIYSWGAASSQLGSGGEENILVPQKMKGKALENRKALSVSAGGQHTLILASNPVIG